MLIYVDDIIITGSSTVMVQNLITKLNDVFALKQLDDLGYFLGIEVKHLSNDSLPLSQTKYDRHLQHKDNMAEAKSISTPMPGGSKLKEFGGDYMDDPHSVSYSYITYDNCQKSVSISC